MFITQMRHLSLSITVLKQANTQARVLQKLMAGSSKPKKSFFKPSNLMEEFEHMKEGRVKGNAKLTSRRQAILNSVFLEHITEMMASGLEAYQGLQGLGISITQVKVATDLSAVYVYWVSSQTQIDDIDCKLQNAAQHLRHELSQLRLIGHVPRLDFLKDKSQSLAMNVESLLARADFGPLDDSPDSERPLQPFVPQITQFKKFEDHSKNEWEPIMRSDVLGVDHAAIMKEIKQSMAKTRKAQQALLSPGLTDTPSSDLTEEPREWDVGNASAAIEAQKMAALSRKLDLERKLRRELKKDQRRQERDMAALILDPIGSTTRTTVSATIMSATQSHPNSLDDTEDYLANDKLV